MAASFLDSLTKDAASNYVNKQKNKTYILIFEMYIMWYSLWFG